MDGISGRARLRQAFDRVAGAYQDARPEYPDALYAALLSLTGLDADSDALCEVGAGPGKATVPLARRGFAVTCVELGAALAAQARRNLAGFDRVTVVNADFESWMPDGGPPFGLVFAATAWHWIDPEVRYRKASALLKPGGHLAFWTASHVVPAGGDPFFGEIQDVYDEMGTGRPAGQEFAMEPWQRARLYGEIRRRLAVRPDGRVRRHWGAVLNVARKIRPDRLAPRP